MESVTTAPTAQQLADPSHPDHAAFNWGTFFALLSAGLALSATGLSIFAPGAGKIQAAITAATPILGELGAAFPAGE